MKFTAAFLAACLAIEGFALQSPHKRVPKRSFKPAQAVDMPMAKRQTSQYLTDASKSP